VTTQCDFATQSDPDHVYPTACEISFFVDMCVTPGIYSPHLEGCPGDVVDEGAAGGSPGLCNLQSREFDQARFFKFTEHGLNSAEMSKAQRVRNAAAPTRLQRWVHSVLSHELQSAFNPSLYMAPSKTTEHLHEFTIHRTCSLPRRETICGTGFLRLHHKTDLHEIRRGI